MSEPMHNDASEIAHKAILPHASAWVGANAGSGKTYILVSRLVRLMLEGVAPEKLLCLTYTRAAAAEMQERLYELLAEWALMPDEALRSAVRSRLGLDADDDQLRRTRALFARALETPGGLRVQTIHAFCESLLKRFPLEAGLSPQFDLLDEQDAGDMQKALIGGLLRSSDDAILGRAMARLTRALSEADLHALGRQIINRRSHLSGDFTARLDRLAAHLGFIQPVPEAESLISNYADTYLTPAGELPAWLAEGGVRDQEKAEGLMNWRMHIQADNPMAAWAALRSVFLTLDGDKRKTLTGKKLAEADPDKAALMQHMGDATSALSERLNALTGYHMSEALYVFAAQLLDAYEREKNRRAVLDYDDLIAATNHLLTQVRAAQWVLYKIDRGLSHILVDEAQDTSQAQWQVISALANEFFNDASQSDEPRTLFAVGDEKQSIFSFQGADPEAFSSQQKHFEKAVTAYGGVFHYVPLIKSRRSAPEILRMVDSVFAAPADCAGVTADGTAMHHIAHRADAIGHVELWPALQTISDERGVAAWEEPQNNIAQDGRSQLAEKIGEKIAALLADERQNVSAGDILILVRKRDGFVEEMTRALKHRRIGVAGADRMVLLDQIAIMDLLVAVDAALNPLDDMAMAIFLRSPIGGLDETSLFTLAHKRAGTLWQALKEAASAHPKTPEAAAFARFSWLEKHITKLPPYELLAQLLGTQGVHESLHARLGPEIDDPINELLRLALAYESRHPASLQGFVDWLRQGQQEIKRDMEGRSAAVRIMTIHGAKGLEAPIVFLPDTCRPPVKRGGSVDRLQFNDQYLPLWRASRALLDDYSAAQVARREEQAAQEERRLLYVAMTRARDRLYIGGWLGRRDKQPAEGSWYQMIAAALEGPTATAGETLAQQLAAGEVTLQKNAEAHNGSVAGETPAALPDWLSHPPKPEAPARYYGDKLFSPSALDAPERAHLARDAATLTEGHAAHQAAAWRGTVVHKLLERLPALPPETRAEAALAYVKRQAAAQNADISDTARTALVDEALQLIDAAPMADLFGPESLAEVPISGVLNMADGQKMALSGQIDRLVEGQTHVRVVDFKTGTPPGPAADATRPSYILQMAAYRALLTKLYPGKEIDCALIWTQSGETQELDAKTLDTALNALLSGAQTLS